MKRTAAWLLGLLIFVSSLVISSRLAHADEKDWKFSRYAVTANIGADGVAKVSLDVDLDFGRDEGHGPYFVFVNRQRVPGDPDHWYSIDTRLDSITSSTGADTSIDQDQDGGTVSYRVGDSDKEYSGVQSYHVELTIHGIVDQDNATSRLDEVNWTAIGDAGNIPIENASVTLTGPGAPSQVSCFTGSGYRSPCDAASEGQTATFSAAHLAVGEGMQVVAGYPVGTFHDAEPELIRRAYVGNMFPLDAANLVGVAVVVILAAFGLRQALRKWGRDSVYVGVTPGQRPVEGAKATIGAASGDQGYAVQFTPPAGVTPGELGVILDKRSDNRDVTATIIDLAVRGHLRIERLEGADQWAFHRLAGTDELASYETSLLDKLGPVGVRVTTQELRDQKYGTMLPEASRDLYQAVADRGWFRSNPQSTRTLVAVAGLVITVAAVLTTIALAQVGLGWWGVGLIGVGITVMAVCNRFSPHTAEGSVVYAQGKGFEQYLTTAEADQLRWEEGQDLFSRYLPYAIVFGCAERWTRLFTDLAAQGRYDMSALEWYYGYSYVNYASLGHLGADLSSLSGAIGESMAKAQSSASTANAGSGSGFSGGGGFGGGGSGAW